MRREDKDLYVTVPISYKTAVLGGKIVVPSADDTIELNVPEGTASGTRFCVRGKGVKTVNGIGNLYVTVEIDIPQRLSREQAKKLSDYENAVSIKSCDNMQNTPAIFLRCTAKKLINSKIKTAVPRMATTVFLIRN